MKKVILIFLTIGNMLTLRAETYVVSADVNYPPFSAYDGQEFTGIDIELIRSIAEDQGFDVEFTADPFSKIWGLLEHSERDIIVGGFSVTENRLDKFNAMDGYLQLKDAVLVKDDTDYDINSVADLANYPDLKIGVFEGTSYEEALQAIDFPNVVPFDTSFLAIQGFIQGKVDAVLDGSTIFKDVLKRYPDIDYKMIVLGDEDQGVTFYVNKDDEALLDKLNAGLATVKSNGKLDQIVSKYIN